MATNDVCSPSVGPETSRWRTRGVVLGTVATLGLGLLWTGSAAAAPETPTTSDQAQQAYLDSSQRAGALNEQVLVAQESEQKAGTAVVAAADRVKAATTAAAKAKQQASDAARVADSYRSRVDAFANASFRGARLGQMSALLTADSADDFLDQVSSLDRVAADTQVTLDAALAARKQAAQAQTDAETSRAAAESAKTDADTTKVIAEKATTDVTARQATLEVEAARYRALSESLSEQERQAAAEAQQRANEQAASAAAAAQAAAEQAAAQPAEQAAPAPAPEPALAAANRSDRTPLEQSPAAEAAAQAPAPAQESTQAPVVQAPAAPAGNSAAATAVAAALSKEGSPYVYGAAGPDAFDCSGLTSWAWAQAGVTIPRTSSEQGGLPEVSLDSLQPGDVVTYYSPVSHVAMYIGNGQVIHASTESRPVYITSVTGAGPNPTGHRVSG